MHLLIVLLFHVTSMLIYITGQWQILLIYHPYILLISLEIMCDEHMQQPIEKRSIAKSYLFYKESAY